MTGIDVRNLRDDLGFGAIITGVTYETLADPAARERINRVFEDRGMILLEGVEPSEEVHAAISDVFGPLKDHPVPSVARVDQNKMPGEIDMKTEPEACGLVEIGGKTMAGWSPWHFDHCYNGELNRAGVLRALEIPPEGGMEPKHRRRMQRTTILGDYGLGRFETADQKPARLEDA